MLQLYYLAQIPGIVDNVTLHVLPALYSSFSEISLLDFYFIGHGGCEKRNVILCGKRSVGHIRLSNYEVKSCKNTHIHGML